MRQQEVAFGIEHQLAENMGVSMRYVHKNLDRGIDDTGYINPMTDDEMYIIGNPGESLTQTFNIVNNRSLYVGSGGQYTEPTAKRQYDGAEFRFDRRMTNRLAFYASYTLSRLSGNYPGLAESDEATGAAAGRVDPNIGRQFDYPIEQFDGHGQPLYGVLPTDRTHQGKANLIYQFPFGTTLGLSEFVASGTPISRPIQVVTNHNNPLYYLGRGSDGRTPVLSQTDLLIAHDIHIPRGKHAQIQLNALTLLNQ